MTDQNEKPPHSAGEMGALDKEAVRTSADKATPADTIAANAAGDNAMDGHTLSESKTGALTDEQPLPPDGAIVDRLRLLQSGDAALIKSAMAQNTIRAAIDLLASPRAAVPEGWKLVPTTLTEDMHAAAVRVIARCHGNDDWPPAVLKAFFDAAPGAPVAEPMIGHGIDGVPRAAFGPHTEADRIDHCGSCGAENEPQKNDVCPSCGAKDALVSTWGELQHTRYRNGERYSNNGPQAWEDGPQEVEPVAAKSEEPHEWAPDRIWLQNGLGDDGSHTWCADSIGGDVQEAEYVRVGAQDVIAPVAAPASKGVIAAALAVIECDRAQVLTDAHIDALDNAIKIQRGEIELPVAAQAVAADGAQAVRRTQHAEGCRSQECEDCKWAQREGVSMCEGCERLAERAAVSPATADERAVPDDGFYAGVCVALQVITGFDNGVMWAELVRACGVEAMLQYAANVEPEEWELAGFEKYARDELRAGKPEPAARASQAAAPALAREPITREAMLAAIDEFELVGDNNLARDLSAEEKFAVSEFVVGFFEDRPAVPADAGEAVAPVAEPISLQYSYADSQHAERWTGEFDSIEEAIVDALDSFERGIVVWIGENEPIEIDCDSLADEVIERIQEQAYEQVGEIADTIGPFKPEETKPLSDAIKQWVDQHGQINCWQIKRSKSYGPGDAEYEAAVALLDDRAARTGAQGSGGGDQDGKGGE